MTSATPSGADGGYEQMERNLEALTALLGTRHRLMKLRYRARSLVRVADVRITATSEPDVNTGAATARLTALSRCRVRYGGTNPSPPMRRAPN